MHVKQAPLGRVHRLAPEEMGRVDGREGVNRAVLSRNRESEKSISNHWLAPKVTSFRLATGDDVMKKHALMQ